MLVLHSYSLVLCFGSLLSPHFTALLFFIAAKMGGLIFRRKYSGFYFVFPFSTYRQWLTYSALIRKFILHTSFSKTFWMVYYKFRTLSAPAEKSLPYFKFPIPVPRVFYTIEDLPALKPLLQNKQAVLTEYQQLGKHLKSYINEAGNAHTDWQTIFLYGGGSVNEKIKNDFPETLKTLKNIPGIEFSMVMFSVLTPGAHIPSHTGPFNSFLRVHLPLILPADITNCYLTAGGQTGRWKEDELLIFDDSFAHEVTNNTNQTRVILMLSVWRPEIPDAVKPLIKCFVNLLNSSPPFEKWTADNK